MHAGIAASCCNAVLLSCGFAGLWRCCQILAKLWLLCVALLLQAVTMMLPVGEQQTVARHGQAVKPAWLCLLPPQDAMVMVVGDGVFAGCELSMLFIVSV